MEEEEYELIPVSPFRRIEKRIDRLEKGGSSNDMVKELIEVVRTNQRIVDEVVKNIHTLFIPMWKMSYLTKETPTVSKCR